MNKVEQVIEQKGIQWIVKRIQSKSPKLYRSIQVVGGIAILALVPFITELQTGMMTVPHQNIVLPICQFVAALLVGMGITATTTTTDPTLISNETKQNMQITTDKEPIGPPAPLNSIPIPDSEITG